MGFPLFILSLGSICLGYLLSEIFVGCGSTVFTSSIFILKNNSCFVEAKFLPFYIKLIPTFFTLFGFLVFFITNIFFKRSIIPLYNKFTQSIMSFLNAA